MIRERAFSQGRLIQKGLVAHGFRPGETRPRAPSGRRLTWAGQDRAFAVCKCEQTWGFNSGTNKPSKREHFFAAR